MNNKQSSYDVILSQVKSIVMNEPDIIANMANISAILFQQLDNVNWAGFYLYKDEQLVLGPFQGKPACIRIPMNKGVCGTSAYSKQTLVVDDVHQFGGHIACDADSNSEIVIPIIKNSQLIGVLDIDSPKFSRFDGEDKIALESVVQLLIAELV